MGAADPEGFVEMIPRPAQLEGRLLLLKVGKDDVVYIGCGDAGELIGAVGGLGRKIALIFWMRHRHIVMKVLHIPHYFLGNLLFFQERDMGMVRMAVNGVEPPILEGGADPLRYRRDDLVDLLQQLIAVLHADRRLQPLAQLDPQGVNIAPLFLPGLNIVGVEDGPPHRILLFQVRKKLLRQIPEKLVSMKSKDNVELFHRSVSPLGCFSCVPRLLPPGVRREL